MSSMRALTGVATAVIATAIGVAGPVAAVPSDGAIAPQLVLEIPIAGQHGVPTTAAAVAINLTVASPGGVGYATAYPCNTTPPVVSNVNYVADIDVPATALVKLSTAGHICVVTSAATDVIVDLVGYVPAGSPLVALDPPTRTLDTRNAIGAPRAQLPAGTTFTLPVAGTGGIPASAGLAAITFTAVGATTTGYLTVYPCDQPRPDTSTLNFIPGRITPNLTVTRLSATGTVCAYTTATIDLLADLTASAPESATGLTMLTSPIRAVDTRNAIGGATAPLTPTRRAFHLTGATTGVPAGATAVLANVTATRASAAGYVTIAPCSAGTPNVSHLNYTPSTDIANAALITVDPNGTTCALASTPVDLVIDVTGYTTGTATYTPLTPTRISDSRILSTPCNLVVTLPIPMNPTSTSFEVRDLQTGRLLHRIPNSTVFAPGLARRAIEMTLLPTCDGFVAGSGAVGGDPDAYITVVRVLFDGTQTALGDLRFGGKFWVTRSGQILATNVIGNARGALSTLPGKQELLAWEGVATADVSADGTLVERAGTAGPTYVAIRPPGDPLAPAGLPVDATTLERFDGAATVFDRYVPTRTYQARTTSWLTRTGTTVSSVNAPAAFDTWSFGLAADQPVVSHQFFTSPSTMRCVLYRWPVFGSLVRIPLPTMTRCPNVAIG